MPPKELDPDHPVLRPLSRAAAQELAIFAALAPVCCSNLAVRMRPKIFATDASNTKGGIVSAEVPEELSKIPCKSADKKGGNVPILSAAQVISHTYDGDFEQLKKVTSMWTDQLG